MRFDGMIFDIEGTLIDCIPQNLRSWQETLSSFGMTVPLEVLQLYSGMDGDDMLQILAPDMDKKLRKRVLEAEGKNFQARYLQSVRAFAVSASCLKPSSAGAARSRSRPIAQTPY